MKGKNMKCKICGTELLPMLLPGSFFCPNDCDKKSNTQNGGTVRICVPYPVNSSILSSGDIKVISDEAYKEYGKIQLLDSHSTIDDFYKVFTKDLIDEVLNMRLAEEHSLFEFMNDCYLGKFNSLSDFAQFYIHDIEGVDLLDLHNLGVRNFIDYVAWANYKIQLNEFVVIQDKNSSKIHIFN